jgi:hypothetical protein
LYWQWSGKQPAVPPMKSNFVVEPSSWRHSTGRLQPFWFLGTSQPRPPMTCPVAGPTKLNKKQKMPIGHARPQIQSRRWRFTAAGSRLSVELPGPDQTPEKVIVIFCASLLSKGFSEAVDLSEMDASVPNLRCYHDFRPRF